MLAFRKTRAAQYGWRRTGLERPGGTVPHSSGACVVFSSSSPRILQPPMMGSSTPEGVLGRKRRTIYIKPIEDDAVEENGKFRPVESGRFQIDCQCQSKVERFR